ncbi:MAG: HAD hydrolase family protein [Phycisphaerales bacterium]|nr:HAD hydrolase family protein [Phycisphaerales bacterium]
MPIRCLCLDVDGVLTSGRLWIDDAGRPLRAFHVQDGLAIRWFQRLGGVCVIITGKESNGVAARARELDIVHVRQGVEDKLAVMDEVLRSLKIAREEVAAIGDDLPDLPMLRNCGFPIAVANASAPVRAAARYVTQRRGGGGAVREAIELLLSREGRWADVVAHYEAQAQGRRGGA